MTVPVTYSSSTVTPQFVWIVQVIAVLKPWLRTIPYANIVPIYICIFIYNSFIQRSITCNQLLKRGIETFSLWLYINLRFYNCFRHSNNYKRVDPREDRRPVGRFPPIRQSAHTLSNRFRIKRILYYYRNACCWRFVIFLRTSFYLINSLDTGRKCEFRLAICVCGVGFFSFFVLLIELTYLYWIERESVFERRV